MQFKCWIQLWFLLYAHTHIYQSVVNELKARKKKRWCKIGFCPLFLSSFIFCSTHWMTDSAEQWHQFDFGWFSSVVYCFDQYFALVKSQASVFAQHLMSASVLGNLFLSVWISFHQKSQCNHLSHCDNPDRSITQWYWITHFNFLERILFCFVVILASTPRP